MALILHEAVLTKERSFILNEKRINCNMYLANYRGIRMIFNTNMNEFLIEQLLNVPIWYHPTGKG